MNSLAQADNQDPHEQIAGIFNSLDRSTENRFMQALEKRNFKSAEKIKTLMFTFEDMLRINPTGVLVLIRQVEKERLTMALKAASEEIKNLFFDNMSDRAARMIREDIEAIGPIRIHELEDAQNYLINTAKTLAEDGEIVISGSGDDDELVF